MNSSQIETNIKELIKSYNKNSFIYDLLRAYGKPKSSITRLESGNLNLSKDDNVICWKKELYFQIIEDKDLHHTIDDLEKDSSILRHHPRFIIVTDHETILAVDTKTNDKLDIEIERLDKQFHFFLPWAGMEKSQYQNENPADLKAATTMARLFDEIKKHNNPKSDIEIHSLNMFMCRMLFCFFAEDTNIFENDIFTNGISSHTQSDGSDLNEYLDRLFEVLNTDDNNRTNLPDYLSIFPYVNGGLFKDSYKAPKFTKHSRQIIIECGTLDWAEINPDIFGSMMQGVVSFEDRGNVGMHYTSVPNIMKVIKPLFLDALYEEFENAKGNNGNLNKLLHRLHNIKIFDPACGSGNFLIIAYKELRRLEIKVLKEAGMFAFTGISLDQFYGIEIEDLAHEIAILALWLAKHQMSIEFYEEFGQCKPTLPLKKAGNIVCGNACQLDWKKVCPKDSNEIYILGNPPYLGQRNQKKKHQEDLAFVFRGEDKFKNLDYISCWFYLASKFINNSNIKCAFVSTNSITQGTQVSLLWPKLFSNGLQINFAYQPFKWTNNAKNKAGVSVVIIGISTDNNESKYIYADNKKIKVKKINAYLTSYDKPIISKRFKMLTDLPKMEGGNQPREGGYLILTDNEKKDFIKRNPKALRFIRRLKGANEVLNNKVRWCIWIKKNELEDALEIPEISSKLNHIKILRENGNSLERNFSKYYYRFVQNNEARKHQIIIPIVSSERRNYIPMSFEKNDVIALSSANVIYDSDIYVFSVLNSLIHNLWSKDVSGKLESRIRYSAGVCYNSFPFPPISDNKKEELTNCAFNIIEEREKHSDKTLAQLYDPDKMPDGLKEAHHQNDLAVERCYRNNPFESDEERLKYLFNLYEKMIKEEQSVGTLF